ncbi:MAG: DUF948 domain-containing protein [Endomicrobiia bacterium]
MNVFIIIMLSIITISFVVLTYYAIKTFIQIQKTAKQAEDALTKINTQLDAIGKATSIVSSITSSISPALLSIISLFGGGIGIVKKFLHRRKKQ